MACITCGDTGTVGTIPLNSIIGSISCRLPCVPEFSTSIQRFRNQILRDVLTALTQRCQAAVPVTNPIILAETITNVSFAGTVLFPIEATSVNTVSVSIQNVSFQIVGFSSAIVAITADIVVTINFQGLDNLTHTTTQTIPFATEVTVPGTFPPNAIAQGTLALATQVIVNDIDPSTLLIIGVTVQLLLTADIRIILPPA
jgi:hypothetical protein